MALRKNNEKATNYSDRNSEKVAFPANFAPLGPGKLGQIYQEKLVVLQQLQKVTQIRNSGPAGINAIFGPGYLGFGNGFTGFEPRIIPPKQRKKPGNRPLIQLSRRLLRKQAELNEELVPIRIELENEKFRIKDTFTWNLHEKHIDFSTFAEIMCLDFCLPSRPYFAPTIAKTIRDYVSTYKSHVYPDTTCLNPSGKQEQNADCLFDDELRIKIKIDIIIGHYNLQDAFEWDINCPLNFAEDFARCLCEEMGLQREFQTAIAHEIREQCQMYTNALFTVGHEFNGKMVEDDYTRSFLLPTIDKAYRNQEVLTNFSPSLEKLIGDDLEKFDKDMERDIRRKRRQNRANRRGFLIPDLKDISRTMRTHIHQSSLDFMDPIIGQNNVYKPGVAGIDDDDDDDEWEVQSNQSRARQQLHCDSPRVQSKTRTGQRNIARRNYAIQSDEDLSDEDPHFIVKLKVPWWKYTVRMNSLKDATSFR